MRSTANGILGHYYLATLSRSSSIKQQGSTSQSPKQMAAGQQQQRWRQVPKLSITR